MTRFSSTAATTPSIRSRSSATTFEFYFDQPGAGAVLDSYPHDFVLIGPDAPSRRLMERRRDWKLLYRDDDSLLYARRALGRGRIAGLARDRTSTRPERISMTRLSGPHSRSRCCATRRRFLVFIIVVADAGRWADPDLWGHLAFGRLILMHGHLPRATFTLTARRCPLARSRVALRSSTSRCAGAASASSGSS